MIVLTNIVCYYTLSAKPNRQLYVLCVALKYLESSYFRRLMTYQRQDGSNDKKKIGQKMIIFSYSNYFHGEVRKSFWSIYCFPCKFDSVQVKHDLISTIINFVYLLSHELSDDLRLQEIKKLQNETKMYFVTDCRTFDTAQQTVQI